MNVAHADGEGASASVESGQSADESFWTLGKRIGAIVVGVATIAATVIAWWQFQGGT